MEFIRLFAHTDDTPLGVSGAAFCGMLMACNVPLRLVPLRVAELQYDFSGRCDSVWDRYRSLLITPMTGIYANAVCGSPHDFRGMHTSGVANWALLAKEHLAFDAQELAACIEKYDACFAATAESASSLSKALGRAVRPWDGSIVAVKAISA
jgi:hypothetical protein